MIGDNKTLALVMIVKDESHIIQKTLQNIIDHIDIDCWYITDTGSTDGTQDLIINFFKEKKIPGSLFHNEWVNFGVNRSLSIQNAFNKSDFILLFDADDYFVGDIRKCIPKILDKDSYTLTLSTCPGFCYKRPILVSNRNIKFFYEGVLHEYLTSKEKFTVEHIKGDYHIHGGTLGNDNAKYARDAIVFENALANLKEDEKHLLHRYTYYLAQSYRDADQTNKAIEAFLNRATLGGWNQEVYVSYYEAAKLFLKKEELEKALFYALCAHDILPIRLEALRLAVGILRSQKKYTMGYILLKSVNPSFLDGDIHSYLFCHRYVYDWEISYETTLLSFYNNDFDVLFHYQRLLKYKKDLPEDVLNSCIQNIDCYISKIKNNNDIKKLQKIKEQLLIK